MNADPAPRRPEPLSAQEARRYSRHLLLPEFGEPGQSRLLGARVAVVGVGGLGSPILQYLAAAGVGRITVFDPDVVDESNLQRQILHTEQSVGRPKVESAVRAVSALNSAVEITAVPDSLRADTVLDQLAGHHLVLDGTDNFPTRYLVSDACEILNIPLVWGSILGFHGQLSVFYSDSGRGITYRDMHPNPPKPGEIPSCSEAGVIGTVVGVIGTSMAMEAVKVLSGVGEPLLGRVGIFDALRGEWDYLPLRRTLGREAVTEVEDLALTCGFAPVERGTTTAPNLTEPTTKEADGTMHAEILTPQEALAAAAAGERTLIDIREADEVAGGMLPGSIHIPMGRLLEFARTGEGAPVGPFSDPQELSGAIIHCQAGGRSAKTQAQLAQLGIEVADMAGGYAAGAS